MEAEKPVFLSMAKVIVVVCFINESVLCEHVACFDRLKQGSGWCSRSQKQNPAKSALWFHKLPVIFISSWGRLTFRIQPWQCWLFMLSQVQYTQKSLQTLDWNHFAIKSVWWQSRTHGKIKWDHVTFPNANHKEHGSDRGRLQHRLNVNLCSCTCAYSYYQVLIPSPGKCGRAGRADFLYQL